MRPTPGMTAGFDIQQETSSVQVETGPARFDTASHFASVPCAGEIHPGKRGREAAGKRDPAFDRATEVRSARSVARRRGRRWTPVRGGPDNAATGRNGRAYAARKPGHIPTALFARKRLLKPVRAQARFLHPSTRHSGRFCFNPAPHVGRPLAADSGYDGRIRHSARNIQRSS